MFALKATYVFAAVGLAFATPALAEYGEAARRAPTASEGAARFRIGNPARNAFSARFDRMRHEDMGRGNGYGRGKPGRPGKPGKGNGHHPCRDGGRCHASPG